MSPVVSIIIPCYNAERYLGDAIRSALRQTRVAKEIIIIDDGSTDNSLDVIRSFGDQVRFEAGPNRGACAARNRGLEMASAEFIQFLDADDLLYPEKIATMLPIAERNPKQIPYCDRMVSAEGIQDPWVVRVDATGQDSVVFAINNTILPAPPLYRKDVLQGLGGFLEHLSCCQDYDLNLRLACAGYSFVRVPEVLFHQRRVPGSISSDMLRLMVTWREVCWRCYRDLQSTGQLTDERAHAFAAHMARDSRVYVRMGMFPEAEDCMRDAFKMHESGGMDLVYSRPVRVLRKCVGPIWAERMAQAALRCFCPSSAKRRVELQRLHAAPFVAPGGLRSRNSQGGK